MLMEFDINNYEIFRKMYYTKRHAVANGESKSTICGIPIVDSCNHVILSDKAKVTCGICKEIMKKYPRHMW